MSQSIKILKKGCLCAALGLFLCVFSCNKKIEEPPKPESKPKEKEKLIDPNPDHLDVYVRRVDNDTKTLLVIENYDYEKLDEIIAKYRPYSLRLLKLYEKPFEDEDKEVGKNYTGHIPRFLEPVKVAEIEDYNIPVGPKQIRILSYKSLSYIPDINVGGKEFKIRFDLLSRAMTVQLNNGTYNRTFFYPLVLDGKLVLVRKIFIPLFEGKLGIIKKGF